MKIFVIDPPRYSPSYDYCFCNALKGAGLDVTLYTSHHSFDYDNLNKKFKQKNLFYFVSNHLLGKTNIFLKKYIKGVEHILDCLLFILLLLFKKPDIVHVQWNKFEIWDYIFYSIFRKVLNIKFVYTVHNYLPHDTGRAFYNIYRKIYNLADILIVHTRKTELSLVNEMGINRNKIKIIPMCNFNYLLKNRLRKISEIDHLKSKQVLFFFGSIRPYKGLEFALKALEIAVKKNTNLHLLVVGKVAYPEPYYNIISELKLESHVTIINQFISDSLIPSYAQYAKVAVLPYREIDQSAAALTLASLGLPLIATNIGGLKDVVHDGQNGFLVEPEDVSNLAQKYLEIFSDEIILNKFAKESLRITREKFSLDIIVEKTIKAYQAVDKDSLRDDKQVLNAP